MTANPKTIHLVAAARPNFMKIAPLFHELELRDWARPLIVHTGQHYDLNMSDAFFRDLRMPAPHLHLGVGSGSHAQQTGRTMMAYEEVLMEAPPDLTVVVGDVNATVAATLAAVKLGVRVAHLEAGLRSGDRTMPEEINRLATDALADLLWTPSPDGDENLLREGIPPAKIQRVGNIMIDSLELLRSAIEADGTRASLGLEPGGYGLVTLHRPANVDHRASLELVCRALTDAAAKLPLVFPVHPRTQASLERLGLLESLQDAPGLTLTEPLGYIAFMNLLFAARLAVTDSGGLQEETTYLGIDCLTLRPNTERPITISQGTNLLCKPEDLQEALARALAAPQGPPPRIDLWDGRTAARVADSVAAFLGV